MDFVIKGTLEFSREFHCSEIEFISLWVDFPKPFGNNEEGLVVESRLREAVDVYINPSEKAVIRTESTKELKLAYPLEIILKEEKVDFAVVKKFTEGNAKRAYMGSTTKRLLEIFEGNLLVLSDNTKEEGK